MNSKKSKILILFSLIAFGFLIFLLVVFYRANIERKMPKTQTSTSNTALHGSIITKDGFNIASSQKLYKVTVDTRNIDPNKKDMFIKLYSLYSGDNEKAVRKTLNSAKGMVTLSYKIDAKSAAYLQELARKLYIKKIFIPRQDPKTGLVTTVGMRIIESGEKRQYLAADKLTPLIGYVQKTEKNEITKIIGTKGVEKSYEYYMAPIQDSKLIGPKDIGNNIILTSDSNLAYRVDGYDTVLSISLKFQSKLEQIIDEKRQFLDAKEIVVGVMNSKTGELLALASTNRYDPDNIQKKDYSALNSTATEYAYEVGSVFKPFIFAIALNLKKLKQTEWIQTYNGVYQLGKRTIRDTHPEKSMLAEDVLVHSSNIGMVQIALKLNQNEIYDGLLSYGFAKKTGIDMPYEQVGSIPLPKKLESPIIKATTSYGYGMQATFIQLLNAYNVFNNKGEMVEPRVVSSLYKNGKFFKVNQKPPARIIEQDVAESMKKILVKTVLSGTGSKTRIPGLEIGGKTGTAHIAKAGGYSNLYNGSFFGFVNDSSGNSYTIGVLAREPKRPYYYFGALSALPSFRAAVELLVEDGYLKIDEQIAQKDIEADKKRKEQKIIND